METASDLNGSFLGPPLCHWPASHPRLRLSTSQWAVLRVELPHPHSFSGGGYFKIKTFKFCRLQIYKYHNSENNHIAERFTSVWNPFLRLPVTYMLNECVLSHIQLIVTPWTLACQSPLSMRFSRQEHWSGLPFPPPGDLPDPGIEPASLVSPALQLACLPTDLLGSHSSHGLVFFPC